MKNFLVTTTPLLDGVKITEYLGVVNANIVIGANFFADFAASITDFFGGSSDAYQSRMNEMYESAKQQLKKETEKKGGNAIISFSVDFDELSGKGKSMFMLSATGTACKIELPENTTLSDENDRISSTEVERLWNKGKIISSLFKKEEITEKQWNEILANPDKDYLRYILRSYYPSYSVDTSSAMLTSVREETSQLVYSLQEEALPILYEAYPDNNDVAKLIRQYHMFEPSKILELLDKDIHLAINILDASKPFYTKEDLNLMLKIAEILSNLPEKVQHIKGKSGIFSKEEDLVICPNGHKRTSSSGKEFCPECGLDNYGLTKTERQKVNIFIEKVNIIKSQLND